jgi:ubiquinone/menaquinone biosynthesis C-methylase UbiE
MHPDDELAVEAGYTLWSACYDDDGNPLIALEGPALSARFGDLTGRRALDLGCGTGRHTRTLVEAGAMVVAADLTLAMLDRARTKMPGRAVGWLRLALPGPLPFADATFDLAVMGLVAEHLTDLDATLAEVARVLRPGGRCLLSALHPDRTAEGQKARFIDEETGLRRHIATVHREIGDYLASAASAGLELIEEETLVVDSALAERLPRALPYAGRRLGWVASWRR